MDDVFHYNMMGIKTVRTNYFIFTVHFKIASCMHCYVVTINIYYS